MKTILIPLTIITFIAGLLSCSKRHELSKIEYDAFAQNYIGFLFKTQKMQFEKHKKYSSLSELGKADLIDLDLAKGDLRFFNCELTLASGGQKYQLNITPKTRTDLKSYLLTEDGTLRGTEKGGKPADLNDPTIGIIKYENNELSMKYVEKEK